MRTLANPHHTLFAVALTMGETAEVQLLVVQLRCSPWVPCLGACHHAMAYALQDLDDPPYSVAPGRGYSRCLLPTEQGPCRGTRSAPTSKPPHTVCSDTKLACENGGPPPLPVFFCWRRRRARPTRGRPNAACHVKGSGTQGSRARRKAVALLRLVTCNRLVNLGISKQQHLYLKTKNLI